MGEVQERFGRELWQSQFQPCVAPYNSISHYDVSLCGDSIYLANVADSDMEIQRYGFPASPLPMPELTSFYFSTSVSSLYPGSDIQVETVYQEFGDRRDIII